MLAVAADTLQALDRSLMVVGVGIAGAFAWLELRRARQRRHAGLPALLPATLPGVNFLHVLAAILLLFLVLAVLQGGLRPPTATAPAVPAAPGSEPWFRDHAADLAARLAASAFMIVVLIGAGRGGSTPPSEPAGPVSLDPPWRGRHALRSLSVGVLGVLGAVPLIELFLLISISLLQWLQPSEPPTVHVLLQALEHNQWGLPGRLLLLASAVLVAPLTEELFYRGLLLAALQNALGGALLPILISGGLFGLTHISVPQAVLPLTIMGLLLGYLRVRFTTLTGCVILHALFNARTMIFAFLAPELLRS